jgi:hypothetical protein
MPDHTFRFVARAQKVIKKEHQIKDVCEACNGHLGRELVGYGCQLARQYFCRIIHPNEEVNFTFDLDRLARWLLSMCYSSARADKANDIATLTSFSSYIMNGGNRPRFRLYVQLVIPHVLTKNERNKIPQKKLSQYPLSPKGIPEIRPERNRICLARTVDPSLEVAVVRLVALQSYYFYLLLPKSRRLAQFKWKKAIEALEGKIDGLHHLDYRPSKRILASATDILEVSKDSVRQQAPFCQDWLRKYSAQFS